MIEIRVRRELKNGEPGYYVEKVRALSEDKLPVEYLEKKGWSCVLEDTRTIINGVMTFGARGLVCRKREADVEVTETVTVYERNWYPKRFFDRFLCVVRLAGARLHRIREKHKREAQRFLKGKEREMIRI